jgi:hypothetical protein
MRIVLVFAAGLAIGAAVSSGAPVVAQLSPRQPATGRIVSGDDVGFRIEGVDPRNGGPTGTWMLRMNGEWVAISAVPTIKPAK